MMQWSRLAEQVSRSVSNICQLCADRIAGAGSTRRSSVLPSAARCAGDVYSAVRQCDGSFLQEQEAGSQQCRGGW